MSDSNSIASLWRRLGAIVYDTFLVVALLMLAALPITYYFHAEIQSPGLFKVTFQLYLFSIWLCYFIGFWYYQHQTPGMKVWRLTIAPMDSATLNLSMLIKRWLLAWLQITLLPLLPLLWRKESYHDRWSQTRILHYAK